MRWLATTIIWVLVVGCSSQGGSECTQDADCAPGYHCRQGDCVYDCTVDAECPEGFTCTARGRCERGCRPTNGGVEICDGVDNDCDGETDEGLLNRCGACEPPDEELFELCGDGVDNDCDGETDEGFERVGTPCNNQGCAGRWVCSEDGLSDVCDAPEPAAEDATCDGVDDDCDGATDEDAAPLVCPLQQGVCAGVEQVCLPGGTWSDCDYGPDYTEGEDTICDTLDNDCDGATDEDAGVVLEGEFGPEASDGLDNNCNGLVDEPGGAMVRLVHFPEVWIDAYEIGVYASPDCSGEPYGVEADDYPAGWPAEGTATVELYACSLGGVMPSGYLSWYRARRACKAQGKQLCRAVWWGDGCTEGESRYRPYPGAFAPGWCNDAWGGAGQLLPTGTEEMCTAHGGTFDMVGNLAEWVQDWNSDNQDCAVTAGFHYECEICSYGADCRPCDMQDPGDEKYIMDFADCQANEENNESFPRNQARAYLGTRCCFIQE